jgi:aryl-alcohol dehydrogenase-like predicted oxidoreductase
VELIGSMHNLHIPIKTIDFLPRTETVIGPLLGDITMGTKVRTIGSTPLGAGPGELRADKLRASLRESLERAKTSRIGYLIAQRMDSMVSIGEVAGGFSGLIGEGVVEMVNSIIRTQSMGL